MSGRRLSEEGGQVLRSQSREQTFRLGKAFGREARGGEIIALVGELGSGKTQFVQGLAKGLGIDDTTVNSPTFTLIQIYEGRLTLTHVDLYRLETVNDVSGLGLEDYLGNDGVAAVEWADKEAGQLPGERLVISIHVLDAGARKIEMQATDQLHQEWLDRVLERCETQNP